MDIQFCILSGLCLSVTRTLPHPVPGGGGSVGICATKDDVAEIPRHMAILPPVGSGGWDVGAREHDSLYVQQLFPGAILEGLACLLQLVDCAVSAGGACVELSVRKGLWIC